MATIKRGSTATGRVVWGPSQPISLVPMDVKPPVKPPIVKPPEPPIIEPPEPPIVVPPEPVRPPVAFPTDAEFEDFSNRLDAKYKGEMARPPLTIHVDAIGRGRWTYDYSLHRQAGDNHDIACAKVNKSINDILYP